MSVRQAETLKLRLERVVRAKPERVFQAWTTSEELQQWSAPEGMTIEGGELELRVGGRWRVVMVEPGGRRHIAFGTYREITRPSRLVYTHAWEEGDGSSPETTVTIEFVAEGDATRVVLTQEGFGSAGSRDGHAEGWTSTLNRLEALFADRG